MEKALKILDSIQTIKKKTIKSATTTNESKKKNKSSDDKNFEDNLREVLQNDSRFGYVTIDNIQTLTEVKNDRRIIKLIITLKKTKDFQKIFDENKEEMKKKEQENINNTYKLIYSIWRGYQGGSLSCLNISRDKRYCILTSKKES